MRMAWSALAMLVTVGSAAAGDPLAPLGRFAGEWEVDGKWSDGSPLRARNVYAWGLGMKIMTDLKRDGLQYQGGEILDPGNGRVYRAKMQLSPDGRTLEVRGFIGVSLFGRSQTWFRE